ncbi:MAG: inositol monophosphatase family protein [Myxococcota bacterium]
MLELNHPLTQQARELAERGGRAALEGFRRSHRVEDKTAGVHFDPVTEFDRAAERQMRSWLDQTHPEHGVLGEEEGAKPSSGPYRWVLDPIDGTRGFICGTNSWTTLVGLEVDEEAVVGVIHQPFTGESWVGAADGARFHGPVTRPLHSSGCTRLEEARLSTTDPRPSPLGYFSKEEAEAFRSLSQRTRVARFSLDAYAYALLAAGSLDLVVETGLERYDVAALIPVVRGAGGRISDWAGGTADGASRIVAAATEALHEAALEILNASS